MSTAPQEPTAMIYYIEVEADGSLKSSGTSNLSLTKLCELSGRIFIEVDRHIHNISEFCWIDNELVKIPPRPGNDFDFNAELRAWVPNRERMAASVRSRRDRLLSACDWVVTRTYEYGGTMPEDWQAYRAALRDITKQTGFPTDITWPDPPSN